MRFYLFFVTGMLFFCTTFGQTKTTTKNINGMEFTSLQLANKLEVLIVHDKRFKNSSAAMAVMVGSMADPQEAQGMAHYLEHMLFLGTKEFPKPDEYSTYMETHGGWDNAYTADEITNYMLEVDNSAIEGALHRFSRFFVNPLFDATYVDREKNAVNSEFEKNIKQDNWREDRYVSLLAKEKHPLKKFSIGNSATLKSVTREDVIRFYDEHYSANTMRLVVMSAEPTIKLIGWVKKYFSDIPNRQLEKPKYESFFFAKEEKKRQHFLKTISDREELTVIFNIEDDKNFWKTKPVSILAKLIGDEGEGSLLSYLKEKGWVLELSAQQGFWRSFSVNMTLTPAGRKNYLKVLAALELYIETLKKQGYPEYLYQDEKSVRKIALDNLEPSSSGRRAADFASSMVDYPVDEFLERNYLLQEHSPADFAKFLSYLNWENSHILLLSKKEKTTEKEDIFGIEYRKDKMPIRFSTYLGKKELPVFKYPQSNKYIPNDFSLVENKKEMAKPEKEEIKDRGTLYFKRDTELGLAKASINVKIVSSIEPSPENALLLALFTMSKEEELREWLYPISEAGAYFRISGSEGGDELMISVSGYSQRLETIFKDALMNATSKQRLDEVVVSEKLFESIKQRYKRDLKDIPEMVAAQRIGFESKIASSNKAQTWQDVLKKIDSVKLIHVQEFAKKFFKKISTQTLAYGNIKKENAVKMVEELFATFGSSTLSSSELEKKHLQYRVIPDGKKYSSYIKGNNNNHAVQSIYRWDDWSVANHAKMLVISQILSQPYFSELRTKQQLGYVAQAGGSTGSGFVGITTLLQSGQYPSLELQEKSSQFLKQFFAEKVKDLSDKDLKPVKDAIINELLIVPTTFAERVSEFSQMAYKYEGRFDIRKLLAEEVRKISASDLKKFLKEKVIDREPATLSFYYFGKDAKGSKKDLPGEVFVNTKEIKEWDYLYPYNK